MYNTRDIGVSFSGDVNIGANGDIELANSFESIKGAINFIVRTDKGDYAPDVRIGGDLGTFVGDRLSKATTMAMEASLKDNLSRFVLNPSDYQVHAIPVTHENVGVFIALAGQYIDENGNLLDVDPEIITYDFPFYEGSPTPQPE
jgi:hypothetical protein